MRILIHDYAGHPFPIQLSRELARNGHDITHAFASGLLTPRGCLQRLGTDPENIRFLAVQMSGRYRVDKYSFLKRRQHELKYGDELVRVVQMLNPDLIVSGQTPTEPQWKMFKAARDLGIPVVSWLQDFYSLAVGELARKKSPLLGRLAGAYYRRLDAKCLKSSAHVITITGDFVPILETFGVPRGKISIIPNWAPLDELPLCPRSNAWSGAHKLGNKFVFLYSGTLAMKHNPELLVKLAVSFGRDLKTVVVVVSEGPGAEYLSRKKNELELDNLLILPFQPFDAMPEVLASADVLLAVLEREAGVFSVPSKVLTYHTAGRPILGAIPKRNLAARILENQGSGICVEPDDESGFIASAFKLRNDEALCAIMGKKGRDYAESEFAIVPIAERFECLFAELLRKRQAKP